MTFPSRVRFSPTSFRRLIALALIVIMVLATAPATIAARGVADATKSLVATTTSAVSKLRETIMRQGPSQVAQGRMPPAQIVPAVRPRAARTMEEHAARVAALEINPGGSVVLQTEQPMIFSAIPLDREGVPIQGLHAEWESSDKHVATVRKSGEGRARWPGTAVVTAKAGNIRRSINVTVTQATEEFGGKKRENTRRGQIVTGQTSNSVRSVAATKSVGKAKRAHGAAVARREPSKRAARAPLPQNPPTFDPLPDTETNSLYLAVNAVGSPPGKKLPGAMTASVATGGTENGNSNFSFGLSVAGLSGRGLDAWLSLNYHSQLWNKSTDGTNTFLTYNVDSDWPAPGFRLGFGQLDDQGSYGFTLTESDGTRRALVNTSAALQRLLREQSLKGRTRRRQLAPMIIPVVR